MSDHAATVREALGWLETYVEADDERLSSSVVAAIAALDALVAERDEARQESENQTLARRDEMELREAAEAETARLREVMAKITDAYTAEAEDHNDGEFALWKAEDLVNAIVAARAALGETP